MTYYWNKYFFFSLSGRNNHFPKTGLRLLRETTSVNYFTSVECNTIWPTVYFYAEDSNVIFHTSCNVLNALQAER